MIATIRGKILQKNPPQVVVECGGLGYEIDVPMSTFYNLPNIGEEVFLETVMIVREDAQLLYGFLTAQEKFGFPPASESQRHRSENFAGHALLYVRRRHRQRYCQ